MAYKIQTYPEIGNVPPPTDSSELWEDYELGFETEELANTRKEDLTANGNNLVGKAFNPCRIRVIAQ